MYSGTRHPTAQVIVSPQYQSQAGCPSDCNFADDDWALLVLAVPIGHTFGWLPVIDFDPTTDECTACDMGMVTSKINVYRSNPFILKMSFINFFFKENAYKLPERTTGITWIFCRPSLWQWPEPVHTPELFHSGWSYVRLLYVYYWINFLYQYGRQLCDPRLRFAGEIEH